MGTTSYDFSDETVIVTGGTSVLLGTNDSTRNVDPIPGTIDIVGA
jgi:hypothetical protein